MPEMHCCFCEHWLDGGVTKLCLVAETLQTILNFHDVGEAPSLASNGIEPEPDVVVVAENDRLCNGSDDGGKILRFCWLLLLARDLKGRMGVQPHSGGPPIIPWVLHGLCDGLDVLDQVVLTHGAVHRFQRVQGDFHWWAYLILPF